MRPVPMPLLPPTPDQLDRAAERLAAGGLVGMPTETVYGLAARALDPAAVAGIYAAKQRPSFNPLIAHIALHEGGLHALDGSAIDLSALAPAGRRVAHALARRWPGPLTLVLPRGPEMPDLSTAGLDTVGLRCPNHPVAQALLQRVQGPLAAPSANRSGQISPTRAEDVLAELGEELWVLDGGPCRVGLESTVVQLGAHGELHLLRPGAISPDDLFELSGVRALRASDDPQRPRSPGTTLRHYAPRAGLIALPARLPELAGTALERLRSLVQGRRLALLSWQEPERSFDGQPVRTVVLAPDGRSSTAAQRLFTCLRELDESGAELLLAEPCPPPSHPDRGLAVALRDRLSRASTPLPEASEPPGSSPTAAPGDARVADA